MQPSTTTVCAENVHEAKPQPCPAPEANDEHVIIVAPVDQDAPAMASVLRTQGIEPCICKTLSQCCHQISLGAGAIVLTEEALELPLLAELLQTLDAQAPWSELPVIVLISGGESHLSMLLDTLASAAAGVTLLDRPVGAATLLRSVEVALRSRRRQYQVRDLLEQQRRTQAALLEKAHQQQALYGIVDTLSRAKSLTETFEAALDSITVALNCDRAALLLCDQAGAMRFKAWRGLSDEYRASVEGHSPWAPTEPDPQPVSFGDVQSAPFEDWLKRTVRQEGIGALAFLPLLLNRKLIGKFVIYFNTAHPFGRQELQLAQAIARQLAFSLERKQSEESLRESEERFRALAENIPQLAWMTNADGWVSWYNQRWFDYTGTTLQQTQGWGWKTLHHPDEVERVTSHFKHALQSGQPWEDTFPLRGKDGQYRWFLSRAFPIRDDKGSIVRWFGTNTDITDRKRVEAELAAAKEQLQQHAANLERAVAERTAKLREMVAELEHVSYAIVHDMRAPLRAMQAFADILATESPEDTPEQRRDFLGRIMTAASRLDKLIQDALDYNKAVLKETPLEPVDLALLVGDLLATYPNLDSSQADIRIEERLPTVMGNEALLTQCFSNLLGNAVKFVAPGVTPKVRVRAEPQDGFARIWVEDNGIGIAKQAQSRLFGLFQRLTSEYEGTGIGLAIVRKVVERMGGKIGVESELGRGSRFWVQLRLADSKL